MSDESDFFKARLLEKVKISEGFMNQYQKTNVWRKIMYFHAIFLGQPVGWLGVEVALEKSNSTQTTQQKLEAINDNIFGDL